MALAAVDEKEDRQAEEKAQLQGKGGGGGGGVYPKTPKPVPSIAGGLHKFSTLRLTWINAKSK